MIKRLFFMAALLAPGLTYGANPSVNLSLQIVPAATIPAPGSIPAPAAAAGFTTQALNADFTVVGGFYSNTANFVDNCGATSAQRFYTQIFDGGYASCNTTRIITDPVYGGQVLLFEQSALNEVNTLDWPSHYTQPGLSLPNEIYVRATFRTTTTSMTEGDHKPIDFFMILNATGYSAWFEPDFLEVCLPGYCPNNNNSVGGMIDWPMGVGNFSSGNTTWNMDLTQYHTAEFLLTSDESTRVYKCTWIDGTFIDCNNIVLHDPNEYHQHQNALTAWIGAIGGTPYVHLAQFLFKKIEIWECPNYQTTGCPGTMITTWP